MSNSNSGSIVNEHYLNKVLALSDQVGVTASEDIYDVRGNKLLGKGAHISHHLQERLIVHRLRKPIESSITIDDGINPHKLAAASSFVCEESAELDAVISASGIAASTIKRELAALELSPAMTVMLTMASSTPQGQRHIVEVAALALAFAVHARLSPDMQRVIVTAAVLHDIGELYIDPDLINSKHVLSAEEWSHVIVHPHIGRLLIQDLANYPPSVGIAVAEHHERLNGTGYPRAMIAGQSSVAGQLVASAELIASLLHKSNALQRAELALRIVNGEHPRTISNVISQASRRIMPETVDLNEATINQEKIVQLSKRLFYACELTNQLTSAGMLAPKHHDLMLRTRERLVLVQRAFMSTGLEMHIAVPERTKVGHFEAFECEIALRELSWRIVDIGRDLAIQLGASKSSIPNAQQLLSLLCENFSLVE